LGTKKIYSEEEIACNSVLYIPGAIVGADGFGFAPKCRWNFQENSK
jgi:hypothetical protein